jgi:hypothetical protein
MKRYRFARSVLSAHKAACNVHTLHLKLHVAALLSAMHTSFVCWLHQVTCRVQCSCWRTPFWLDHWLHGMGNWIACTPLCLTLLPHHTLRTVCVHPSPRSSGSDRRPRTPHHRMWRGVYTVYTGQKPYNLLFRGVHRAALPRRTPGVCSSVLCTPISPLCGFQYTMYTTKQNLVRCVIVLLLCTLMVSF